MASGTPLVLVVGAGPTGMTMAIELKRAGLDVRIIDKSDHMARWSQALVVQARTLEQFQRYGVADEAVARGQKLDGGRFYSEGKELLQITLDQIPGRYPYVLFLPQNETEAILNSKMESLGAKTERGVELLSLTQPGNGANTVTAVLRHPDGTEETVQPRWLIGCDGAHSSVRKQTGVPFEGGSVGLSFYLGDLELDGPDTPGHELVIHTHRGDLVFMGRLSDRVTRLIVALHDAQQVEPEQHHDLNIKDFQDAVDRLGIRVTIHQAEWMTPFHVNDRQAKEYRIGNVFLAGDASHIHSPVGGQGMNTGIQDAANLAWKLAAVARGGDDRLLDSYHEERGEVGRVLLRSTERVLKIATAANPLVEKVRDALVPYLGHLHPLQKAVSGFISETAIEYRSSSVVSDHGSGGGTLRAGDRMPDLSLHNPETSLLHDWTDGKHLVLLLDPAERERGELAVKLDNSTIAAHAAADFDADGQHQLGASQKNNLYIIRPDGYIGFRGSVAAHADWEAYARQDGLLRATN